MKNKKLFLGLIYLAIIITIVIFFGGCTAAKDARAYNRVINNPTLAEKVLEKVNCHIHLTYPIQYIKGKDRQISDTTYEENINQLNDLIDSLLEVECPVTKTFNIDSLKNRIRRQVEKECKPEYHLRIDTMIIEDTRRLQLTKDDPDKAAGVNEVLIQNVKAEKSKASKWIWYFWILAALMALGIFLRIKKII